MCTPVRFDGLELSRRKVKVAQHWCVSWFVFFVPEEQWEILILEPSWHQMFMNRWHQSTEGDWTHKSVSMSHWIHKHTSLDRSQLDKIEKKRITLDLGNALCGQTLRGRYRGRIVWAGTVIWNKREYRDVFYANQALPRPTRESTVSPQNCRFLETKTKSCLFCFQSGLGPPSLPFQSKIACLRHLVVSRQERGHKMMLNCFSKEFYKVVMMIMQNCVGWWKVSNAKWSQE